MTTNIDKYLNIVGMLFVGLAFVLLVVSVSNTNFGTKVYKQNVQVVKETYVKTITQFNPILITQVIPEHYDYVLKNSDDKNYLITTKTDKYNVGDTLKVDYVIGSFDGSINNLIVH